jgi:hypothetical protein
MRGVCVRALKFRSQREGILGKSHCCQPDSGNPTVRDERGACGNTDKENSKRARKAETLKQSSIFLSCSAPYFYPTTDAFTRNWIFTPLRFVKTSEFSRWMPPIITEAKRGITFKQRQHKLYFYFLLLMLLRALMLL